VGPLSRPQHGGQHQLLQQPLSAPPAPHNATVRGDPPQSATRTPCSRAGRSTRRRSLPCRCCRSAHRPEVTRGVPARSLGFGYTRLVTTRHRPTKVRFAYNHVGTGAGRHPADRGLDPRRPCTHHEIRHADHQRQHFITASARAPRPTSTTSRSRRIPSSTTSPTNLSMGPTARHTTKVGFDFQEIFAPTFATLDGARVVRLHRRVSPRTRSAAPASGSFHRPTSCSVSPTPLRWAPRPTPTSARATTTSM